MTTTGTIQRGSLRPSRWVCIGCLVEPTIIESEATSLELGCLLSGTEGFDTGCQAGNS